MATRVVLHVGLMKSGTTFMQGRLNANRALLAAQDVLFPGPTWRRHSRAVADLIDNPDRDPGAWASLREEIRSHSGIAIVSMEYLGPMSEAQIATVAEDFAESEVRVVLTVRDLGRTVPAMWQEAVKNRQPWSWPDYVESIRRGGEAGKKFWRRQGAARIAERWAATFEPEQVSVVTVPPPGAPTELLWDRFREVAGIGDAAWQEAPRANESLGVASVALMARLNAETAGMSRRAYKRRAKTLANRVLVLHKPHEDPIGFTAPPWLRRRASSMVADLTASGVRVVGDLEELTPVDVPGVDPASVSPEAVGDAAVAAIGALLRAGGPITPRNGRQARTSG